MSSATGARVLSATSITSSFRHISHHHSGSSDEHNISSTESYATLSDNSSEDDEIVYSISDLSIISAGTHEDSSDDDDFVLLGRSDSSIAVRSVPSGLTSPSASILESQAGDSLSDAFSHLQMEDSTSDLVRPTSQATTRRRRRGRGSSAAAPVPAQAPASTTPKPKKSKKKATPASTQSPAAAKRKLKKQRKRAKAQQTASTSTHSASEKVIVANDAQGTGTTTSMSFYQDAVQYISTFLSSPPNEFKNKSNLTFLQALIIELGLCPATPSASSEESFSNLPSLPRSLRAAKALLKSRVFVNVRDYLDMRHKGLEALQSIMHPSRKALIKDLSRGKGKRKISRGFVKESGLAVLLVTCYH